MPNHIDIAPIGNRKVIKSPKHELLALEEYLRATRKIVGSYSKKLGSHLVDEILCNDDAIANICYDLIIGDCQFSGKGSIYGYRLSSVNFAIKHYLERRKREWKNRDYSIAQISKEYANNIEDEGSKNNILKVESIEAAHKIVSKIDELAKNNKISKKGIQYLKWRYLDGKKTSEIMDIDNVSKRFVNRKIFNTIEQIRLLLNEEDF